MFKEESGLYRRCVPADSRRRSAPRRITPAADVRRDQVEMSRLELRGRRALHLVRVPFNRE